MASAHSRVTHLELIEHRYRNDPMLLREFLDLCLRAPTMKTLSFQSGPEARVNYYIYDSREGVATLVGMVFGLMFGSGFVFIFLVIIPGLLTNYIAVGSLTAFIGLPVLTYLLGYETPLIILASLMTLLNFYLHRANIQRIMAKEEIKISDVLKRK